MAESLLTIETVIARVGFKRSKIYMMVQAGDFPAPIKIGNASRWPDSKVEEWIQGQMAEG